MTIRTGSDRAKPSEFCNDWEHDVSTSYFIFFSKLKQRMGGVNDGLFHYKTGLLGFGTGIRTLA